VSEAVAVRSEAVVCELEVSDLKSWEVGDGALYLCLKSPREKMSCHDAQHH